MQDALDRSINGPDEPEPHHFPDVLDCIAEAQCKLTQARNAMPADRAPYVREALEWCQMAAVMLERDAPDDEGVCPI